jgi:uncharacterized protein with GYD domain
MEPEPSPKGEKPTRTYFLLFTFTDAGLRTLSEQPARARRAFEIVRRAGGTCTFYLTVGGAYDMVSTVEGLDEIELKRLVLALNAPGTVKTTVLTGLRFRADQWADFIGAIAPASPGAAPPTDPIQAP